MSELTQAQLLETFDEDVHDRLKLRLDEAEARLQQASREAARRRDLFARQLIAREALEQATQAETTARSAADQERFCSPCCYTKQAIVQIAAQHTHL